MFDEPLALMSFPPRASCLPWNEDCNIGFDSVVGCGCLDSGE